MAKRVNSAQFKGVLDVSFEDGYGTIKETTKDGDFVYDIFEVLKEFDGKSVSFSIREEQDIHPIEEV